MKCQERRWVSRGRRGWFVSGWALVFLLVAGCASTVKKAENWFTPSVKSEKEMGREFAQEAAKKLSLVDEPDVLEYVHRIGQPIVDAAQPMSYRFRFHVVKSPTLNAFAVPGGHIYLYSGLLLKAQHVREVVGVMAHELAHVKHRHTAQMIGKGTLVSLATLAAILVSRGEPAVMAGAAGAGTAMQLSFVREFEQEADRFGLFYMYQAGYDPRGLIDFFQMMLREQRFSSSSIPAYLLTHPMAPERLGQIEDLIQLHRLAVREPREEPDFYRFQAILQAEVGGAAQVLPWFQQRVTEKPEDAQRWHQLALANVRYGRVQEALTAYQRALELDPKLATAWADLAVLLGRMGRQQEAESMFREALALRPEHPPFLAMWGETLVQAGRAQEAMVLLDRAVSLDGNLIRVHEMRARAKKDLNDEGGFHLEMATFQEKMDRSVEAMKHLRLALKLYGEETPQGEEVKTRILLLKSS
jgi:predicted Zn-dependent protease